MSLYNIEGENVARDLARFAISTRTGTVKAMIEVGVAVGVGTREVAKRMAEWEEVDFVWQASGEQNIVLVVDAADTRSLNVTHRTGVRAGGGREHEDAAHPRRATR